MGGGVRSSARLSGGGGGGGGGGGRAAPHADAEAAAAARSAAAHSAARAAAAERRARAAERAREVEDSPRVLRDKCRRLARALTEAKHLVVYTGAGISTAADIPDYRGPRGVWTRLRRGETVGRVEVARARPTFTHMALTALWARGLLKFVVSQNCDGLHLRAGLPRRALAELHGDMFAEQCAACRRVYLRTFDTTERTARHAHGTRRLCHACGRELRDTIVHFGERGRAAWPLNWAGALRHAAAADVVLCLGSSLKVLRRYPRLWRMQRAPHARPALYIVNLQWTPKDAAAALKINARCDTVMAAVARRLRLRVPRYSARGDPLLAHAVPLAPLEAHTARGAPLSPPPLGADSDSDACYTLSSPSSPSSTSSRSDEDESDASGSGADTSDPDDRVPLGRLAERLRASRAQRPPAPPAPTPPPPAPSAASHDYYTKPITPQPRRESPAREELPSDGLRSFQVSMSTCEATILLRAEHAPSALPPPPEPPPAPHAPHAAPVSLPTVSGVTQPRSSNAAPCKRQCLVPACVSEARAPTAELRRYRMYRPAGPAQADGFSRTNGHLSPTEPDRNFNSVSVPTVKTEEETLGNGAWGGGSRLQRLLECAPRDLDEAPIKVDKTEPWTKLKVEPEDADEAVADRKCKVQLPVSARRQFGEVKSELGGTCKSLLPCASPTRSEGAAAAAAAAAQLEEMGEAEAAAAAFIRRAVLVCRASLYPGLHTILGGARGCAWCTRRYGARRCLWYGAPPDAGTVRTARRLRGRRYLCACCPAHSSHSSHSARSAPASPLPDDAGWYGKGYRKGRRRRR